MNRISPRACAASRRCLQQRRPRGRRRRGRGERQARAEPVFACLTEESRSARRCGGRGAAARIMSFSGADCGASDGNFRSGAPQSGGTFEKKFTTAGSFSYHCEPHCWMGMKGEIIASSDERSLIVQAGPGRAPCGGPDLRLRSAWNRSSRRVGSRPSFSPLGSSLQHQAQRRRHLRRSSRTSPLRYDSRFRSRPPRRLGTCSRHWGRARALRKRVCSECGRRRSLSGGGSCGA